MRLRTFLIVLGLLTLIGCTTTTQPTETASGPSDSDLDRSIKSKLASDPTIPTGAIAGACIPEFEAKRYDEWMRGGGVLLSAHCDNTEQIHSAEEVLKMSGAKDIAAKTEAGRPKWPPVFLKLS